MKIDDLIPEAFKDRTSDIKKHLRLLSFDIKTEEFCLYLVQGGIRIVIFNELGKILRKSEVI